MSEVKPELLKSAIQSAVDCATAELRRELEEVKRELWGAERRVVNLERERGSLKREVEGKIKGRCIQIGDITVNNEAVPGLVVEVPRDALKALRMADIPLYRDVIVTLNQREK